MIHPDYGYDEIADKIFYLVYDEITEDIKRTTGVTEGKFMDVGCGGGHLGFSWMKKTEMEGTFVDIKPAAIEIAEKRAQELGFSDKCQFFTANVEQLPFPDETFDLIISRGSIPFWENQKKAFSELFRVLAKGGKAYIGGGLGSPEIQKIVREKMHENGLQFYFERSGGKSKVLPDEDYAELFSQWNCSYQIIHNEEKGHWIILEKGKD